MLRVLRVFAWMRWRVLVNSIERTGARDTLQRLSIALEQIAPLVALVLLVPSMLAAAALGAAAGYALADGNPRPLLLEVTRYLLLASLLLGIVGPLAMPAAERTNAVRLLLLPIPRATLYAAQAFTALIDPWILLAVPLVLLVPAGLLAGGAPAAAVTGLTAGVLLLIALVGVTSLAASLLHLIVRDRRRGELIAVLVMLVLPMIGMLPALLGADRRSTAADRRDPPRWIEMARRVAPYVPTESYVQVLRNSGTGSFAATGRALAVLGLSAATVHAIGLMVYGRLLESPGGTGSRRTARRTGAAVRLPGFSPAISAIAMAQLRLALRTPRGRTVLLSPLILFMVFGAVVYRGGNMELGLFSLENGLSLAAFGAFGALLMILPIAMNQFAVDGAGLTLVLLSPLSDRDLLAGKAVGNALVFAGPALACVGAALAAFPGGSPWLWTSLLLSLASTYVLVAPAAAALSAIFPRAVDMNSIGHGSNAHAAAGFIGFGAFLAAGAPCALLVLVATRLLQRPMLAALFLLIWLGVTAALATAAFVPVRKLFARRRETLATLG